MKRSEAIDLILSTTLEQLLYSNTFTKTDAELVLKKLEQAGILPPRVAAKVIRGEDFPFGSGCSMRCDCEDCNPNFGMTVWEKE